MLYSAGQTDIGTTASGIWLSQLRWLLIAAVAGAFAYRTSFRLVEWAAPWLYGLGLALLVLTLAFGSGGGTAASTKSWFTIGGVRLGQPVELAKLATILMLARWFAARREVPTTLRGLAMPVMIAAVPAGLVMLQPDLGSAIVFASILFAGLFWAGVPGPNLIFLASPVVSLLLAWSTAAWSIWMIALFVMLMVWRPFILESIAVYLTNSAMGVFAMVVWGRLSPYQQNRLLSFLDPGADEFRRTSGYQGFQSMVAIGSGGWFGNGFTQGPQKRTGYVPEHWTDFIFSVVGEELGFIGVMVALGLFAGLLGVMIQVARRAADPFTSMVVFGLAAVIFTHVFENVGMTVSIMPITGIPLPFFSYGGSFTLSLALAMGLTLRAAGEGRAASYVDY